MTPWNSDLHLVKYKTCTIHWYDSRLCVCASVVVIVDALIFYFEPHPQEGRQQGRASMVLTLVLFGEKYTM